MTRNLMYLKNICPNYRLKKYAVILLFLFAILSKMQFCYAGPANANLNDDPNFLYGQAVHYYNNAEYDLAAEQFLNVYKNHAKSSIAPQAGFYLGRVLLKLKREKEALEIWETLYNGNQFYGNKIDLFKLYVQFGTVNLKLEEFKKLVSSDKQNSYRRRIDYIDFLIFLNKIEEAAAEYEAIIKEQPTNFYIYKNIGDLYFRFQRYKEALSYYEKLLRYEPQNEIFLDLIGRCYYRLKDNENALKYWNKIIANDKEWNRYNYLANIFQNHNMMPDAIKTYKTCQQKAGSPTMFFSELAELYEITNDFDELLNLYFKIMEHSPSLYTIIESKLTETIRKNEDARAPLCGAFLKRDKEVGMSIERMKLSAVVFTGCGKYEEAFSQNLKLAKNFNSPELLEEFGVTMLAFEKYELFKKSFESIYENFPETEAVYRAKYRQAMFLKEIGNFEASLFNLIEVKKDANFSSLYNDAVMAMGIIYLENLKKPELAFECFDEIEKKNAGNVEKAIFYKALYCLYKGDYEKYGEYSNKLINQNNEFSFKVKAFDVMSDIYKGTTESALEKAHEIISSSPAGNDNPEILKNMALIRINAKSENTIKNYFEAERKYKCGEFETAENIINKMSDYKETCEAWLTAEIKFLKAQVLKDRGKKDEYIKILDDIEKNSEGQYMASEAAYQLGEMYLKNGDKKKAEEKYSDILKKYPESLMINTVREKIRKIKGGTDEPKRRPSFFGYL